MSSVILSLAILVGLLVNLLPNARAFHFHSSSLACSTSRQLKSIPRASPTSLRMIETTDTWIGAKSLSQKDKEVKTILTIEDISKILPHRYPFLLVDRVVEFEAGKRAVGVKSITANEPQFTGHFPDRPIMPGVLMIEAMAQLGGIICLSPPINNDGPGKLFFFTGVNGVRWKSPVTPGDQLIMEMTLVDFNEKIGFAKMSGKSYVGGKLAVSVDEFSFAVARG